MEVLASVKRSGSMTLVGSRLASDEALQVR
jgi:hypothetical protein